MISRRIDKAMRFTTRFGALALIIGLGMTMTVAIPQRSHAADEDIYRQNTDINRMFHKLGRGIVNVLTGWIEIPKNVAKEWRQTDPFTGLVLGTIKGVGWGFGRTIAGVYEVITFPFPIPKDYNPVMQPEFILPSIWGESLPLSQDSYMAGRMSSGQGGDSASYGSPYYSASGPTYGKSASRGVAAGSTTAP
jgi:putative exosortase-associated protein (TIGR04073 family)